MACPTEHLSYSMTYNRYIFGAPDRQQKKKIFIQNGSTRRHILCIEYYYYEVVT